MTTLKSISYAPAGYYKGNVNFKNDANGVVPYKWIDSSGTGCTATVVASYLTHNKVFDLYDNSNGFRYQAQYNFPAAQEQGIAEFWIATSDITKSSNLKFFDGGADLILLQNNTGTSKWSFTDHAGMVDVLACANATWYRVRIDFNAAVGAWGAIPADHYNLYINGVEYNNGGAYYGFAAASVGLTGMYVISNVAHMTYHLYVDAIGLSWLGNYTVGDNANIYDSVVYKHAKTRRGTHESHHDFSSFDITKMIFPEQI